jgi:pseudaminic acid biosynthesis-associated methylase
MTDTNQLWSGSFGNAYHDRNRVDWKARVPFWQSAIEYTTPASVFELGCGPGWNLMAIAECAPATDLFGADLNLSAVNEARSQGFEVQQATEHGIAGMYPSGSMDLVATCGCLIHVPPAQLEGVMRSLVDLSARYVLAVEYDADTEEEVEYRGVKGALWKRPYGALYMGLGLRLISFGEADGFNACHYYLMEKI